MDINPFVIFFASIFTNNILLTGFLGMCSFLSVSSEVKTSFGLGQAVTFVLSITAVVNYFVYNYILVRFELEYLRFIVFIIVIAAVVQILEMIIEKNFEFLYHSLGIFLPLITVNCAILGVALFMIIRDYNLLQSLLFAVGSGIGWTLAIVTLASIRQRLSNSKIPSGLRGAGISLIITGIIAMAFLGFSGIVKI